VNIANGSQSVSRNWQGENRQEVSEEGERTHSAVVFGKEVEISLISKLTTREAGGAGSSAPGDPLSLLDVLQLFAEFGLSNNVADPFLGTKLHPTPSANSENGHESE
jgi:hypothetical protein